MAIAPTRPIVPQRHSDQHAALVDLCLLSFWIFLQRLGVALARHRSGDPRFSLPICVYDGHCPSSLPGGHHRQRPRVALATTPGDVVGMMTFPNPLGRGFVLLVYTYDGSPSSLRLTVVYVPSHLAQRQGKSAERVSPQSTSYTYDTTGKSPELDDTTNCHQALTKPQEGVVELCYDGYRCTQVGLWLSADPIKEDGGLNLYAYVGNDPVNMIDPDGLIELQHGFNWGGTLGAWNLFGLGLHGDGGGGIAVNAEDLLDSRVAITGVIGILFGGGGGAAQVGRGRYTAIQWDAPGGGYSSTAGPLIDVGAVDELGVAGTIYIPAYDVENQRVLPPNELGASVGSGRASAGFALYGAAGIAWSPTWRSPSIRDGLNFLDDLKSKIWDWLSDCP